MTYSERIVEDYPTLSRRDVAKLLGEHGFEFDTPTGVLPESERSTTAVTYANGYSRAWDLRTTFDAEMGVHDRYRTAHVMAWLGY